MSLGSGIRYSGSGSATLPKCWQISYSYYQGAASGGSLQRRQCAWRWGRCRCCSGSCSRGRWGGPASGSPAHLHTHTTRWLHQSCGFLMVTFRIFRLWVSTLYKEDVEGGSKTLSLLITLWNNVLFQCPFVTIWVKIKILRNLLYVDFTDVI